MFTVAPANASSGFPWIPSFLLALPAFGLAAGAGLVGLDAPAGIAMGGAAAAYLTGELLLIQPRLERRALAPRGPAASAQQFLQRALALADVEQVAAELGRAVTAAVGPHRSVLLAPAPEGGVRVLTASGAPPPADIGDPTPAFLWLGDAGEPIRRHQLVELGEFEGAAATLALIDALGCNVILPLRHRGLLLGLAAIAEPPGAAGLDGFYRAMRAYATVAMANTYLDAEARGKSNLTRTFDLATAMQESLMPDERPVRRQQIELKGLFRPVDACGGDLWAWRELRGGKVLVVIADATGHGAAPALLAAVAKGAIDAHWQMSLDDMDPAELLRVLNRAVHRTGRKRYMMTAFAAIIDPSADRLRYANAGQNFPYFISRSRQVEPLIARGNALGAAAEARFETHERPMHPGDKLLLYTDGITEAGSPAYEPWGEKRFRAALAASAGERAVRIPDLLMTEVEQFLAGREMSDDITMVAVERPLDGEGSG